MHNVKYEYECECEHAHEYEHGYGYEYKCECERATAAPPRASPAEAEWKRTCQWTRESSVMYESTYRYTYV